MNNRNTNSRKQKIEYLKALQAGKPLILFNPPTVVIENGERAYIDSIGVFPLKDLSRYIKNVKTIFLLPDNDRSEIFS